MGLELTSIHERRPLPAINTSRLEPAFDEGLIESDLLPVLERDPCRLSVPQASNESERVVWSEGERDLKVRRRVQQTRGVVGRDEQWIPIRWKKGRIGASASQRLSNATVGQRRTTWK